MCGIAGIVTQSGAQNTPDASELGAMIARLSHRGPDGISLRIDGGVGLAHARLAIIDIAGGQQPIHNESLTVWVVLNGEIFNYLELRDSLVQRGHHFYTASDTEVIVHLYEEYGEDFVLHLNGQFALAVHDTVRNKVLLARDRVGIRPLFYTECRGRLLFASEVKALFALAQVPRELDLLSLAQTYNLWGVSAPNTSFNGIQQLSPGTLLVVDQTGANILPAAHRYWHWDYSQVSASGTSEAQFVDELDALLSDSVRLQLRADVPVGAYLSGGLDSSAIVAMIRRHSQRQLRTFSLTFSEREYDESRYQREAAEYFGSEHSEILVRECDIANAFAKTVWHVEAPLVRTAAAPMMLLSEHVRKAGIKAVLTGEGADEIFAGYDLFKEAAVSRFIERGATAGWRSRLLERLYPYLKHSPMRGAQMAQLYLKQSTTTAQKPFYAHASRMRTSGRVMQYLRPEVRDHMREKTGETAGEHTLAQALLGELPEKFSQWPPLHRDQYVEASTLLPNYLLSAQGDRVAMANSIEGRVPFLDHRLIEFANRLPVRMKLCTLNEKYLLKRTMRNQIPDSIVARTKQPFRTPDSACFFLAGKPHEWVAQLLSEASLKRAALFDAKPVAQLMRKCASGRAIGYGDNMACVSIVSTMLLHQQFVQGNGAQPV